MTKTTIPDRAISARLASEARYAAGQRADVNEYRRLMFALADQLEAAMAEVAHWRDHVVQMSSVAKREVDARELIEIERDALLAEAERLRRVVDAAVSWRTTAAITGDTSSTAPWMGRCSISSEPSTPTRKAKPGPLR